MHTHFLKKIYFWKWGGTGEVYLEWGGHEMIIPNGEGVPKCRQKGRGTPPQPVLGTFPNPNKSVVKRSPSDISRASM